MCRSHLILFIILACISAPSSASTELDPLTSLLQSSIAAVPHLAQEALSEEQKSIATIIDNYEPEMDGTNSYKVSSLLNQDSIKIKITQKDDDQEFPGWTLITSTDQDEQENKKPGIVWRTGAYVGNTLFQAGIYMCSLASGSIMSYYLSAEINRTLVTTSYNLIMYTTQNAIIGNLVYAFGTYTLPPVTTMLVFQAGCYAPTLLYYTAKVGWKAVYFTARGVTYTYKKVLEVWSNSYQRDDFIELIELSKKEGTEIPINLPQVELEKLNK